MKRVSTINKCNSNQVYTGITMQIIKGKSDSDNPSSH